MGNHTLNIFRGHLYAYLILLSGLCFGQVANILPYPNQIELLKGDFLLDQTTGIISGEESKGLAEDLHVYLQDVGVPVLQVKASKNIVFEKKPAFGREEYEINIQKNEVKLIASGAAGWFYSIQTLKQLIPDNVNSSQGVVLKNMRIVDGPRFSWRAFMLDESRHFRGKEGVKVLLDEMARLKMNVFHWHLVDDQGWRVEIKKYPLLTQIGSTRSSTQVGPEKYDSPIQTGERHSGYYTQEEIREIVQYAAERQITVVPEIEMPGHASAAIASYSWLGASKEKIDVPTTFGVFYNVYDVSDPKVIQFLHDVLDEIMDLFPSEVIHIGGDEVKYDQWKESPSIQAYMAEQGLSTPAELQVHFTNNISAYLQSKGRRMMGWNEILGLNLHHYQDESDTQSDQELAKESVVHFWKGDLAMATEAASSDYDIVNSLHSNTYLNYAYRNIPLQMAYEYNPVPDGLQPQYHDKVIGLGCQMWTEWAPSKGQLHYQVFPRIAAYAEVGWTNMKQKDYTRFLSSLEVYSKGWEGRGIYFAPIPIAQSVEKSN